MICCCFYIKQVLNFKQFILPFTHWQRDSFRGTKYFKKISAAAACTATRSSSLGCKRDQQRDLFYTKRESSKTQACKQRVKERTPPCIQTVVSCICMHASKQKREGIGRRETGFFSSWPWTCLLFDPTDYLLYNRSRYAAGYNPRWLGAKVFFFFFSLPFILSLSLFPLLVFDCSI